MARQELVPIAVDAGFFYGSGERLGSIEGAKIRNLPTLHRLMQNARLPVDQLRVLGEPIAAEHDMVLGPVLRNSDVLGSTRLLSAHTRHKS